MLAAVLPVLPFKTTAATPTGTTLTKSSVSDGTLSLADGGTYYLNDDIDVSKTIEINGAVTLDLNGHVLKMTGSGSVIKITGNNSSLTLNDNNPTAKHSGDNASLPDGGVITGGKEANGAGIFLDTHTTLTMNGGTIYDCKTASTCYGGGVYIEDYSKFIMNGGAIRNCSAFIGGGVFGVGSTDGSNDAEITMNGGAIYDCTDTSGSGTSAISSYKMYTNGGTVKGTVDLLSCEISETGSAVGTKFYDKVKCITISGGVFYGEINGNPTITGTDYSVSFNLNGGSGSIPTQRFINTSTATALKPTDPTREGYIFTGWYNGTEKYEFNVPVTENTTLNAKWVSGNLTSESDFMQALEADVTSVKLKNNISLSDTLDLSHRDFTLDLNGFTLTGNIKFKNDRNAFTISNLTLTDSSATGTGVLNGNIEIGGGTAANTTSYLIADGGTVTGTVTMPDGYNGGTITCRKNTPTVFKGDVDAGKYGNITGGIFYGKIIESGLGCINALEVTYNIGDDRYALMVGSGVQPVIAPIEPTVPQGKKFTGWYKDKEFKKAL